MASLEREGVCGSDRLFPALGQGLLHISEPVKGVTLGKNSERGFDIWKSLLGKGGMEGRGGSMGALPPSLRSVSLPQEFHEFSLSRSLRPRTGG